MTLFSASAQGASAENRSKSTSKRGARRSTRTEINPLLCGVYNNKRVHTGGNTDMYFLCLLDGALLAGLSAEGSATNKDRRLPLGPKRGTRRTKPTPCPYAACRPCGSTARWKPADVPVSCVFFSSVQNNGLVQRSL